MPNWNAGNQLPEPCEMHKMQQSCLDFAPFLFTPRAEALANSRESRATRSAVPADEKLACRYQPQLELLMGTESGSIYCFDPHLRENGVVVKYNY